MAPIRPAGAASVLPGGRGGRADAFTGRKNGPKKMGPRPAKDVSIPKPAPGHPAPESGNSGLRTLPPGVPAKRIFTITC